MPSDDAGLNSMRASRALRDLFAALTALGLGLMLGSFLAWNASALTEDEIAEIAALVETAPPEELLQRPTLEDSSQAHAPPPWRVALIGETRDTIGPVVSARWGGPSDLDAPTQLALSFSAAERLAQAGWTVVAHETEGDPPFSVEATRGPLTVHYWTGSTEGGRRLLITAERDPRIIIAVTIALPLLAAAALAGVRRAERRLPPRRQRIALAFTWTATALLMPSALCAPWPFNEAPWAAGRMHDLGLGLLLNVGVALWITAVATITVWRRQARAVPRLPASRDAAQDALKDGGLQRR